MESKRIKVMIGTIQIEHNGKKYGVAQYKWSNTPGSETVWDIAMNKYFEDVTILIYEMSNRAENPEFTFQLIDEFGRITYYKVTPDQVNYVDGSVITAKRLEEGSYKNEKGNSQM